MLNILLKYYKDTKLQGDRESQEYKSAKYDLGKIFEEAEDRLDISPEIQKIISQYMSHTDEGLILREIKEELSNAGFTLPYFHQHLDIEGFNDATEDDMRVVLNELETLQSRLYHMYSDDELEEKVQLIEHQTREIKGILDPSVDLEGFDQVYDPMAAEDFSRKNDEVVEDFGQGPSSSPRTPIEVPEDSDSYDNSMNDQVAGHSEVIGEA